MATVVAAMIAVVGLAINEIIFIIASMIIAPVLTNVRNPLGEEVRYVTYQDMRTKVEKTWYLFRFLPDILRFLVTIIIIILISWVLGFIAASLNWIDLSAYFATNSQGDLIREGSPSNQLASRINISRQIYFASIIATALGGALLTVTHYHAKEGIADQIIGVAIAASFAPPASALGLAFTLNNIWEPNIWQLGALTANFLIANVAALYSGLFAAKLLFGIRKKDELWDSLQDAYPDIIALLYFLVILILTIFVTLVIFY